MDCPICGQPLTFDETDRSTPHDLPPDYYGEWCGPKKPPRRCKLTPMPREVLEFDGDE